MADTEDIVTLWMSSISSNLEMKKNQKKIKDVLEVKKIPFKQVDISTSSEYKDKMREVVGNPTCLPPQLTKGMQYIGDYQAFDNAVEAETLHEFLNVSA